MGSEMCIRDSLDLTGMDVEAIDAAEESETLVEWLAYNQDSLLQALMGSN